MLVYLVDSSCKRALASGGEGRWDVAKPEGSQVVINANGHTHLR